MVTYTLTAPATIGTLGAQQTITSLQLTGLKLNLRPELAALGAAELEVTLTDPKSGAQEMQKYRDATVPAFWAAAQTSIANEAIGDAVARAVFAKLIADKKLPKGTLATS